MSRAAGRPPAVGHRLVGDASARSGATQSPGAAYLAALPLAARETLLKKGQVVLEATASDAGPTMVRAAVRLERPLSDVYALVSNPQAQSTYMPHVVRSQRIGERTPEGERDEFVVSFLLVFKYRTQHWFYPEEDRVEWALDPHDDSDLVDQSGYWQLYALDPHTTIAEYGTQLRLRGTFLEFLRTLGQRGVVDDALKAFRRYADAAPAKMLTGALGPQAREP